MFFYSRIRLRSVILSFVIVVVVFYFYILGMCKWRFVASTIAIALAVAIVIFILFSTLNVMCSSKKIMYYAEVHGSMVSNSNCV